MKKKSKLQKRCVLLLAISMMLTARGLYAQVYPDLVISGGVATVTSAGQYNIPNNGINFGGGYANDFRLAVVLEKVSPSAVTVGAPQLTGISRAYPSGHGGGGNATYATVHLPGPYTIVGAEGRAGYEVNFISDPLLTVAGVTKHVSEWVSPIVVPSGASVTLAVPDYFLDTWNRLYLNSIQIDRNQTTYTFTQGGSYELQLRDGVGSNPIYSIYFTLDFQSPANIPVTGVTLDQTTLTKTAGDPAVTLHETVLPSNATNKAVTWTTSSAAVATVTAGVVNFTGAGTATITVTTADGGKTATCAVTVTAATVPVSSVSLDQTNLTKNAGDPAVTLTATVLPGNATNPAVSWSTSNASVATVTNGVVSFTGAGTATITVTTTDGGKTATCAVTVTAATVPVSSVSLDQTNLTKTAGDPAVTLTATVLPGNATNPAVSWSTSNASVAIVTNGVVNFTGAGTATITVTTADGGKTATCAVTVTAATVVNAQTPTISGQPQGAVYTQNATASAMSVVASVTDGGTLSYQWYSNTVNSTAGGTAVGGNSASYTPVTAAAGTLYCYVVVTNTNNAVNGTKTATATSSIATISVNTSTVPVTGVSLNKKQLTLTVGDTESLIATVFPANASNKACVWSHNNPSVISLVNAEVTALAAGTSRVIVETRDGLFRDTCDVTVTALPVPEYTVTISSNAGGTVSPYGAAKVKEGESLTVSIVPSQDYVIEKITLDGVDVVVATSLVINNVRANRSVVVTFKYQPVANEEVSSSPLKAYALGNGSMRLEAADGIGRVSLYSPSGVLVRVIEENSTEVVVEGLPRGLYFVRVPEGGALKVLVY